jgi:5-methylcytosine-specific restriction enzyme A
MNHLAMGVVTRGGLYLAGPAAGPVSRGPAPGGPLPLFSRSSRWAAARAAHLLREKDCQVCGAREFLQVHHVRPVHLFPEDELDPLNMLTLCQPAHGGCHLLFGHLRRWASYNVDVRIDAARMRDRIAHRPLTLAEALGATGLAAQTVLHGGPAIDVAAFLRPGRGGEGGAQKKTRPGAPIPRPGCSTS